MRTNTVSKKEYGSTAVSRDRLAEAARLLSAKGKLDFYDGAFGLLKFGGVNKSSVSYAADLRKAWRK